MKFLLLILICLPLACCAYPPNFLNKDGCLYAYMDDGGHYQITFPDATETQKGSLGKIVYDKATTCTKSLEPGKLVVMFNTNDNNMVSMTVTLQIKPSPSEGYWQVDKATLEIVPINRSGFPDVKYDLKPVDIYAGQSFSYSCSQLVLQNMITAKTDPHFKLTLKRFQLQPFAELPDRIFAPSYDCAVWFTLPVIMGAILMLFILFTVLIGVSLLIEQGNQTGDLKFSKQGGMLMNQAQLDATKG